MTTLAADANDIVESLKFAAQNSLKTAVLGGGHQVVGVQLLPNGLTIDTSNLTAIEVDPDSETAYVQAGAVLPFHMYVAINGNATVFSVCACLFSSKCGSHSRTGHCHPYTQNVVCTLLLLMHVVLYTDHAHALMLGQAG